MRQAKDFLTKLTEVMKPPPETRHVVLIRDGVLLLQVPFIVKGKLCYQEMRFDDSDLDQSSDDLVAEILKHIRPELAQLYEPRGPYSAAG